MVVTAGFLGFLRTRALALTALKPTGDFLAPQGPKEETRDFRVIRLSHETLESAREFGDGMGDNILKSIYPPNYRLPSGEGPREINIETPDQALWMQVLDDLHGLKDIFNVNEGYVPNIARIQQTGRDTTQEWHQDGSMSTNPSPPRPAPREDGDNGPSVVDSSGRNLVNMRVVVTLNAEEPTPALPPGRQGGTEYVTWRPNLADLARLEGLSAKDPLKKAVKEALVTATEKYTARDTQNVKEVPLGSAVAFFGATAADAQRLGIAPLVHRAPQQLFQKRQVLVMNFPIWTSAQLHATKAWLTEIESCFSDCPIL